MANQYDDDEYYDDDPFAGISRLATSDFQTPGERGKEAGDPWLEPNPPWHMWGSSADLRVDSTGLDPDQPVIVSEQLSRVSYRRPETWSFWFGARLKGNQTTVGGQIVVVLFEVAVGIGRSNFITGPQPIPNVFPLPNPFDKRPFCKFVFSIPGGESGSEQPYKWTTQVPGPRLDDRSPEGDGPLPQIDHIAAQDIQCNVSMLVLPVVVPTPIVYEVEAHAYFAPRSHIRPDWFEQNRRVSAPPGLKYRGKETGGS